MLLLYRNLHCKAGLGCSEHACCHGNGGDVTGAASCFLSCSRWVGENKLIRVNQEEFLQQAAVKNGFSVGLLCHPQ